MNVSDAQSYLSNSLKWNLYENDFAYCKGRIRQVSDGLVKYINWATAGTVSVTVAPDGTLCYISLFDLTGEVTLAVSAGVEGTKCFLSSPTEELSEEMDAEPKTIKAICKWFNHSAETERDRASESFQPGFASSNGRSRYQD